MKSKRYQQWQNHIAKSAPGYDYYAGRPQEGIEQDAIESFLNDGFEIRTCEPDSPMAEKLTRMAVIGATRIFEAKAYHPAARAKPGQEEYYAARTLFYRAQVYTVYALGRSMLGECELDLSLISQASHDREFTALSKNHFPWTQFGQCDFHEAVLLALVAGDVARAASLMTFKKNFTHVKEMRAAMVKLVRDIARAPEKMLTPNSDESLAFQALYDDFRTPDMNEVFAKYPNLRPPAIVTICLALIKERYVVGNTGSPNWLRVFASVSE